MVPDIQCDVAIAGGGLAGGLIALALKAQRPALSVVIVEAAPVIGGNHIWSFFDGDLRPEARALVEPLISYRWPAYDIAFPSHRRTIDQGYNSIESEALDAAVRAALPANAILRGRVAVIEGGRVTLDDARVISANAAIDTRGPGDVATLDVGWQKFVGQILQLDAPHGLTRPIVMDATVEQIDGYRFVYVLPFGERSLFVEDTYYSDSPDLDVAAVQARIGEYAASRGWQATPGNRIETGVLPVVIDGDFDAYWGSTGANAAKAGMRAGLFHPTTGYSLPDAARLAIAIAASDDLSSDALAKLTRDHASGRWRARGFYRMLDTMLFRAALPHERRGIMEKFYRLPPALIGRFYAGETTWLDRLRILTGKPPIPIPRALGAILRK